MRNFTKIELKHLKFKLIEEEGFTPDEADQRLKELVDFQKRIQKPKKKGEKNG